MYLKYLFLIFSLCAFLSQVNADERKLPPLPASIKKAVAKKFPRLKVFDISISDSNPDIYTVGVCQGAVISNAMGTFCKSGNVYSDFDQKSGEWLSTQYFCETASLLALDVKVGAFPACSKAYFPPAAIKAIKAFLAPRNAILTEFPGSPPFNTVVKKESKGSVVINVLWVEGEEFKPFAADFDLKGKIIGEVRERKPMGAP